MQITELARVHHEIGAARSVARFRPGSPSATPGPLTIIGCEAEQPALYAVNALSRDVAPLSCQFVKDVAVCGSGYVFHGEELLTDGSHLSDVTIEWVNRPMPDSPRAEPPAVQTSVDKLCVVATAPGHLIYGHWLIDFIPRFMIARDTLGAEFHQAVVALPHDTPGWALSMLEHFTGIARHQCLFYQRGTERLAVREACIPSYGHTDYFLHPYVLDIMQAIGAPAARLGDRKLCISRAGFEAHTHGVKKLFSTRQRFEALAAESGYEIVCPETMSLPEQVALFRSASHVVGEYGSALHSTIFAPPGLRVGYVRCPNAIQLRIAARAQHQSVIILPEVDRVAEDGVQEYSLNTDELYSFFKALDTQGASP